MCGEKAGLVFQLACPLGSPPRMRGKGFCFHLDSCCPGITPACAGKSPAIMVCSLEYWGSPPRMRGKVCADVIVHIQPGITPACAGKSAYYTDVLQLRRDHPRVCGEKRRLAGCAPFAEGSPPRMRGKVLTIPTSSNCVGITPACAGKSGGWQAAPPLPRDHPRVCGEKTHDLLTVHLQEGSPPRVRGKVNTRRISEPVLRITPACAGKSSIQHLTASLGEFEVQKGHPVPHLRQRLQVWPDHARHLRHGLILHASRSAGQGRRLCPGPCPDTAGSGTPRGPSPAKRPHTSPPAATPGGCRAWQSGATAPGSR